MAYYETQDPIGYENTPDPKNYATGCSCSCCRTEGRTNTQPHETCTVTRYRDSDA